MMNLSELLTSIKMDLGIYGLALPFKNPDDTLYDVIKLKTIKSFSPFMPQTLKLEFDLKTLTCLKNVYTESAYVIPDVFGDRKILYIKKMFPKNKLLGNGYLAPVFDDGIELYTNMMMTQANANLISQAAPPITFKFQPPNIMYVYNLTTAYGEIDVEFALEHSPNLTTINPTTWESFYELALLDIKKFLYNTLKHYTEIQTAYGNINLKIDEWSNAENDRKELIDRWRDVFHLDVEAFYVI